MLPVRSETALYQIDRTELWRIVLGQAAEAKLVDAAMAGAQRTLKIAAQDPEIIRQARVLTCPRE